MAVVRTVLGDVAPEELGVCDAHDHLFIRSAMMPPGQELDDYDAAVQEATLYAEAGGRSIIQWTPYGLGRRADLLPKLSQETGVQLVAATGLHRSEHYDKLPDQDLAELFVRELTQGIGDGGVRAGLIKIASGFHGLDKHTSWVLDAAAEAQRATGAPIGIHHELGTGADAVLDRHVDVRTPLATGELHARRLRGDHRLVRAEPRAATLGARLQLTEARERRVGGPRA